MRKKVAIGVDIGGTNLRFGLVSEDGRVLARGRMLTKSPEGVEKVLSRVKDGIGRLMNKAKDAGIEVVGVGVGMPGIITHDGVVKFSPNLNGWSDIPLKARLIEEFTVPIVVENDANAYAFGEAWMGAGKGVKSLVCITLGTGVGGGIILDGKIWRGADGMAGEVGHITVEPGGRPCPCGNRGCLERYSSATAVAEQYAKGRGEVTAEAVAEAARAGDRAARRVFDNAGRYLGVAAADVINLLNIEAIVIGGGLSRAWDLFIGPLKDEARKRAFSLPAKRCRIVRARLGDRAAVIGAAGLLFKGDRH